MKYERPEMEIYKFGICDTIRTSVPEGSGEEDNVTWG